MFWALSPQKVLREISTLILQSKKGAIRWLRDLGSTRTQSTACETKLGYLAGGYLARWRSLWWTRVMSYNQFITLNQYKCRSVYLSVLFASQEQVLGLYPHHPIILCHNDAIKSLTDTVSQASQVWFPTYCMSLTMKCSCSKCLAF